ncbi:protein BatD, partial [Pseudoalteromonas sp. S1610]
LLPQTPRTYTLAEITLPWYKTKMNRIIFATLPERTITVTPSTTAPANSLNTPVESTLINTQADPTQQALRVQRPPRTPRCLIIVAVVG